MTNPGHDSPASHGHGHPGADENSWNDRYRASDQIWSGQANGALVAEVAELTPGRALDVGCGEGADAVWLTLRGWRVTALDLSSVALDRASTAATAAGADIKWLHTGLLDADLPAAEFDLVTAQYPALLRTPTHEAERRLLALVAPGGTLLVVHHADIDIDQSKAHGFDPADYIGPAEVLAALDESWKVEVDEMRPRDLPSTGAAHHVQDQVLRARRMA